MNIICKHLENETVVLFLFDLRNIQKSMRKTVLTKADESNSQLDFDVMLMTL